MNDEYAFKKYLWVAWLVYSNCTLEVGIMFVNIIYVKLVTNLF